MALADILGAFLATALIFAAMPGPARRHAAARTVAGGPRAGLLAAPVGLSLRRAADRG
jgi:threonine/homoserine/homoserine lactone efflux protein